MFHLQRVGTHASVYKADPVVTVTLRQGKRLFFEQHAEGQYAMNCLARYQAHLSLHVMFLSSGFLNLTYGPSDVAHGRLHEILAIHWVELRCV